MSQPRTDDFTFVATGDSILTRRILTYEDANPSFRRMVDLIRSADASFTNLEVLVHDFEGYPAATSGGTYMRAPPYVLDELTGMGFDLFSAATNHSFDYSHGGLEATIDHLDARDIAYAGIGRTLFEAREPAYVETPGGRVGLVSASTSYPAGSQAGEQTPALGGRPGLNPIKTSTVYTLDDHLLENLREIADATGIERIKQNWFDRGILYGHDWTQEEFYHFGDMKFQEADGGAGVVYDPDGAHVDAFCASITDAARNADWTVASIHTHQGKDGMDTTPETPDFMRQLGERAIDAGADIVVCHGPHVLRGLDVYEGKPIFHSLGNFIVQNETVSRLPHESFVRYDLEEFTRVSDVFEERLYDESGAPKGDLTNTRFWRTVLPTCTFSSDGTVDIQLHPITLHPDAGRPQRGIPCLASGSIATDILEEFEALCSDFGTTIEIDGERASLSI